MTAPPQLLRRRDSRTRESVLLVGFGKVNGKREVRNQLVDDRQLDVVLVVRSAGLAQQSVDTERKFRVGRRQFSS